MATHNHIDDDDDFGGDFSNHSTRRSGNKRSFGEIEEDEDDFFDSKKGLKVEENAPGAATGMILSLRESLQNCKDALATCQTELEAAKSEIQKWHSSFQNEPFIPSGTTPEPKLIISYLQALKSSDESLREQLEKAKKKEAAYIVTFAKREQEVADLKSAVRDLKAQLKPPSMQARRLLLDPAIHEEFTRLKNLVEEKDKKVKELHDNIAAVNFTPQSKMGKMLMAKCRTLQEENEEIGNQAAEGKMHELAMKLALQKSQNAELRSQFEGLWFCPFILEICINYSASSSLCRLLPSIKTLFVLFYCFLLRIYLKKSILQETKLRDVEHKSCAASLPLQGLYKHMEGLTNDVESSNEMVLMLQEQMEEKDQEIERLKNELKQRSSSEDRHDIVSTKKVPEELMVSSKVETERN